MSFQMKMTLKMIPRRKHGYHIRIPHTAYPLIIAPYVLGQFQGKGGTAMTIPETLLTLLEKEKLCFLSTSYQDQPHVSLMNFTFLKDKGLIVLTSRADTTKVTYMKRNPAVALLFTHFSGGERPPVSCTVYGTAQVVDTHRSHVYREAHLLRHPGMDAFILGDQIAVVTVSLRHVAMADIQDQVSNWSVDDSPDN